MIIGSSSVVKGVEAPIHCGTRTRRGSIVDKLLGAGRSGSLKVMVRPALGTLISPHVAATRRLTWLPVTVPAGSLTVCPEDTTLSPVVVAAGMLKGATSL